MSMAPHCSCEYTAVYIWRGSEVSDWQCRLAFPRTWHLAFASCDQTGLLLQNMGAASHMLLISEMQTTGKCSQMEVTEASKRTFVDALHWIWSRFCQFILQIGNHGANSTRTVSLPVTQCSPTTGAMVQQFKSYAQFTICRDPHYFWLFSASPLALDLEISLYYNASCCSWFSYEVHTLPSSRHEARVLHRISKYPLAQEYKTTVSDL